MNDEYKQKMNISLKIRLYGYLQTRTISSSQGHPERLPGALAENRAGAFVLEFPAKLSLLPSTHLGFLIMSSIFPTKPRSSFQPTALVKGVSTPSANTHSRGELFNNSNVVTCILTDCVPCTLVTRKKGFGREPTV